MFHDEIEGVGLHKLGYYTGADPGAIGAGMAWIDISGGTGNWQIKLRDASDTGWEVLEANPLTHTHDDRYYTETEVDALIATEVGDYLPLAGGVMTGDIQFSDVGDGIQFHDGGSAYFDAMVYDPSTPQIVIGGNSVAAGGRPYIKMDTIWLRVGVEGIEGGEIAFWDLTAGDWVTVIRKGASLTELGGEDSNTAVVGTNVSIGGGGTVWGASAENVLHIFNAAGVPTGNVADGVMLYAEDVAASSELKVRDEAGNVTTLSPHNFGELEPSEEMAWAYHSERGGKTITVDMLRVVRLLEELTGETLAVIGE